MIKKIYCSSQEVRISPQNLRFTYFRYCSVISRSGPNAWRDAMTPTMILEAFCKRHRLAAPQYAGTTQVSVAGRTYNLQDYERNKPHNSHWGAENERLACYVLNGLPIVKEHIETRILRSKLQPAFDQVWHEGS